MAASNKGPKKKAKQLNISTIISGDGRPIRLGKLQEDDRSSGVLPSSPVEQQPDSGAEDSQGKMLLWLILSTFLQSTSIVFNDLHLAVQRLYRLF